MSKYGAKKTTVDGIKFDSMAEARRFSLLMTLERLGHIQNLERQVVYVLAPSVKYVGDARAKPALRYVADFEYLDTKTGEFVTEDTKGVITEGFRIKRHLMKSVHGIDVKVTK